MATVYAGTGDSWRGNTSSSSWSAAQGDATTTGSMGSSTISYGYSAAVYNRYFGGRGGNTYDCRRVYLPFDLSGESGTVSSAELKVYMDNYGTTGSFADAAIVEATALANSHADFGNVYSTGTTWGDTLGSSVNISTAVGYHTFTLNSDGIALLNSSVGSGTATIGLVGAKLDRGNTTPNLNGDYTRFMVYFADYTGTSRDPYLDITYATAVTENAIFFGHNF